MAKSPAPRLRPTVGHLRHLEAEIQALRDDLADAQLLYETTLEHGTALENELMLQNQRMEELQGKMRRYLSPQLYQALLGGTADTDTKHHRRVRLTIYFSDMVGFSALTDSLEPELLSDLLNSYLTRMTEIALAHGGTVDKFVGDAIMVFFGAPEFSDDADHAHRCVRMALEMRSELEVLRERWRQKGIDRLLQVRAGINTGYCTVGNFGSEHRMDYTIIGGQVNLASRLQTLAPPDQIYLSGATYALVEDLVVADPVGPVTVKGIHTPVEVWSLRGMAGDPASASDLLAIEGDRLRLQALDLDLNGLSAEARQVVRRALRRALEQISL